MKNEELVTLLNEGSRLAYTEIYNRCHAALYIHIFNSIRSREESRDILHDLFSSLWLKRAELSLQTKNQPKTLKKIQENVEENQRGIKNKALYVRTSRASVG